MIKMMRKIMNFLIGLSLALSPKDAKADYWGIPPELLRWQQLILARLFPTSTKTGWFCPRWQMPGDLARVSQTWGATSPKLSDDEVKKRFPGYSGARVGAWPR
jgi:hypothetical protein